MLDFRQSSSCVCLSDYINVFKELIQRCELVEDPSFTTARFIRGLRSYLKRDVTLSSPFTLDEAYHKALEVEKLNKLVPMRRSTLPTRPPTQVAPKPPQISASASNVRTSSLTAPSPSPLSTSTSPASLDKVVQCFSYPRRGHYASECPHRTLALEHEPINFEEETVEPEGSDEDLIDVENSLLYVDSHLEVVQCLLSNQIVSEK